jgi:hypothetical protein
VIRADKFRVSRPLYAVDLESYRLSEQGGSYISAVWFRRRRQPGGDIKTVACAGQVWNYLRPRPQTAAEFLAAHDDNRYGGDCAARWDGANLWCLADEAQRAEYLRVLEPMLAAYPEIPPGFSGWWGFGS